MTLENAAQMLGLLAWLVQLESCFEPWFAGEVPVGQRHGPSLIWTAAIYYQKGKGA